MTLAFERVHSVNATRKFLSDLLDPKKTPKVPREIRDRAYCLLRHYPLEYEMDNAKTGRNCFSDDYDYGSSLFKIPPGTPDPRD